MTELSYCVVVVATGEVVYTGSSLASAAGQFEPGTIACFARTAKEARSMADYVAAAIKAQCGKR